eukprot:COSAG02_NODE_2913_length_7757_cov_4566.963698_8_plen_113_part_00
MNETSRDVAPGAWLPRRWQVGECSWLVLNPTWDGATSRVRAPDCRQETVGACRTCPRATDTAGTASTAINPRRHSAAGLNTAPRGSIHTRRRPVCHIVHVLAAPDIIRTHLD